MLQTLLWASVLGGCDGSSGAAPVPGSAEPPPERIVAALLSASRVELESLPGCTSGSGSRFLSDDIAAYLAEMTAGANEVSAECWPPDDGMRICTVTFNHDSGELVWTRGYRFEWSDDTVGELTCFTIP